LSSIVYIRQISKVFYTIYYIEYTLSIFTSEFRSQSAKEKIPLNAGDRIVQKGNLYLPMYKK